MKYVNTASNRWRDASFDPEGRRIADKGARRAKE
jgi:hypothetical protein